MIMPKKYFFDKDGNPLAFGKIYTYQAGTTTNKETFTSEAGDVANPNPVILNGEGYASIYLNGSYNIVVDDQNDNNIWSEDPVSSSVPEEWVNCEDATYLSTTSFKVSGNLTSIYEAKRRVQIDNGVPELKYSTIVSSSFAAGETTVIVEDAFVAVGIVGVCASIIGAESQLPVVEKDVVLRFNTVQEVIDSEDISDGDTVHVKEYSTGNSGSAHWKVVLASSVTIDTVLIKQCDGDPLLAIVYIHDGEIKAGEVGIFPGSGQTAEISVIESHAYDNHLEITYRAGTYDVDDALLVKSSSGSIKRRCLVGFATFNYVGVTELDNLFIATEAIFVDVVGIDIVGNHLVVAGFDVRTTLATSLLASFKQCHVSLIKQTSSTVNPVGIQVIGVYKSIVIDTCEVNFVSYTNAARASTGIGIAGVTGLVVVKDSIMANISTPSDQDADGLKVFSADFVVNTTPTRGRATITGNEFRNCEGRGVKLQLTDFEMSGNNIVLEDSFTTITEWRGVDAQAGGGDIHSNNFRFGVNITWGTAAKLLQVSSIRNDGVSKNTYFTNNSCQSRTDGMSLMASLLAEFGSNNFILEGNTINGATLKRLVQFRAQNGAAAIVNVKIKCKGNSVPDLTSQDMFFPFDDEDFGSKLFLEFTDNEVTNNASLARFYQSPASFSVGNNYRIGDNRNVFDRIDWPFDMDALPGGNRVFFGSQTITNIGPAISTFGYLTTDGSQQRMFSNSGAVETHRNDTGTWRTVTLT